MKHFVALVTLITLVTVSAHGQLMTYQSMTMQHGGGTCVMLNTEAMSTTGHTKAPSYLYHCQQLCSGVAVLVNPTLFNTEIVPGSPPFAQPVSAVDDGIYPTPYRPPIA